MQLGSVCIIVFLVVLEDTFKPLVLVHKTPKSVFSSDDTFLDPCIVELFKPPGSLLIHFQKSWVSCLYFTTLFEVSNFS